MKTMIKSGLIKRVQNNTAPILEKKGWAFVAKKVWKDMKDGGKTVHTEDAPENSKKTKKNKKPKKAVEATVQG